MPNLLVESDGGIALVTLNRPDCLNALDVPLHRALNAALTELAEDDAIRCVVVTGAGRAFCAGGDLKAMRTISDEHLRRPRALETFDMVREHSIGSMLLHEMPKPTIAMINGPCAGAGLSLAGACDFRFAGSAALLVAAFTGVGIPGDGGGAWFWSRILGTAKARELYILNERYDADRALALGLVHRVFENDTLKDRTMAAARQIASAPGSAMRFAKDVLNHAEDGTLESVVEREAYAMALARAARGRS